MLTMRQKKSLSWVVRNRYQRSKKNEKTEILNEFVSNTGYNRSYARRILGSLSKRGRKRKYGPRGRIYDAKVFYALKTLWIAADNICGQRLKPFLPELVRVMEREKELKVNKQIKEKLFNIGSATIDRMLSHVKKSYHLKGRSTTKPGTLLRASIPVKIFSDWDETTPGYFETDLVAFCGETVRGDYVNGLNIVDVATAWVGLEAVMGKAQSRVNPAIDGIRQRLPYKMLGLDSDNGTEFINGLLKRYCEENEITFTRIRPYRKNDNCYVEQKNYTVLRRFLGYNRYDTEEELVVIKEILKLVEDYVNFFQPVMKLSEKKRDGAKTKKKHDIAQTPFQRLLASKILTTEKRQELINYYETLNPMKIKREIYKLTDKLNKINRYKIRDLTNT